MQTSLKIVIVDENPTRAAVLEDALHEAGHEHVARLDEPSQLIARICALEPDVVLIDLEKPNREKLEQMFEVSRALKRPLAIFVEESDKAAIDAAIEAGVSAFVVGTLHEDRKVIDRAKGILMQAKNLPEDAAYGLLRKTAMNEKKKIAEVAQSVVTA